jgi:hypothetical protein
MPDHDLAAVRSVREPRGPILGQRRPGKFNSTLEHEPLSGIRVPTSGRLLQLSASLPVSGKPTNCSSIRV